MNIHEYQAKRLLADFGLIAPAGAVARNPEEAGQVARDLGGNAWMVKAQVHAGGRGQAGGVRRAASAVEVEAAARELLGQRLVTHQTGSEGKAVRQVLVEQAVATVRELYLAVLIDRSAGRIAVIGAAEGGEDIEARAARAPESIERLIVDPAAGLRDEDAMAFCRALGLEGESAKAAAALAEGLVRAFEAKDASLIEINPLGLTAEGALIALDVKMIFDDNALFRHADVEALRDEEEVDPTELEAKRYELNYVKLAGDIGCLVNGAGLALATLDQLKRQGGEPADFMDIRPVATREQIAVGFEMIAGNPAVKAILVNIYGGGILRCDTVAEGIGLAVSRHGLQVPLILRAAGTNHEICKKSLQNQGIRVTLAADMAQASRLAVEAVKREAA